ncbi:polysaccharide pyruvyl transferase family protein, partial [Clostridium sp. HV4-5-A1G]
MKIAIITIHDPKVNYGSTLQSCATYSFVKQLGYDVEIINYCPQYKTFLQRIKRYFVKLIFLIPYIIRANKFKRYFMEHAILTKKYKNYKDLSYNPPKADVYITGSDVIWNRMVNPEGNDDAFYLRFVQDAFKMSYAPSMGEIQNNVNLNFIKQRISDFKYISVREYDSKKQLEDMGFANVECVLDPVFLLDKKYYLGISKTNIYGRYILVYLMSKSNFSEYVIKFIKKKLKLKVLLIGGFKRKCDCEYYDRTTGPIDFITYINNAEYIVTDSFHCVSFSLIFNKEFCFVPSKKCNMRIENILSITHLLDRIVSDYKDIDKVLNPIKYDIVNK